MATLDEIARLAHRKYLDVDVQLTSTLTVRSQGEVVTRMTRVASFDESMEDVMMDVTEKMKDHLESL